MIPAGKRRWFPGIVIASVLTAEAIYRLSGLMNWTANFFQLPGHLDAYFWLFPIFLGSGFLCLGHWRLARDHAALWIVAGTLIGQLSGTIAFALIALFSYQSDSFLDILLTADGLTTFFLFSVAGPAVIGLSWFQGAISALLTYAAERILNRQTSPGRDYECNIN